MNPGLHATLVGGSAASQGLVSRRSVVLPVIFGIVLVETLFQTLVPVVLTESRGAAGVTVGWCLAVAHGGSLLLSAPAATVCDRLGPGRVLVLTGALSAGSLVLLVPLATDLRHELWVLPVVGYGMARGVMMMAALSLVSQLSDPVATQSRNSATQRSAAIVGTVVAVAAIMAQSWVVGMAAMAVLGGVCLALVSRLPAPGRGRIPVRDAMRGYAEVARLLRDQPGLRASGLLNVNTTLLFVLGNSFLPVVLVAQSPDAARWVVLVVVCRDAVAVVAALALPRLTRAVGLRGTLGAVGLGVSGSLALLAVSTSPWALASSALVSGVALGLAIGSTNILATQAAGGGVTQRLSASYHPSFVAALILPVLIGMLLDTHGPSWMFAVPAVVAGVLGVLVVHQASPARGGSRPAAARRGTGPSTNTIRKEQDHA